MKITGILILLLILPVSAWALTISSDTTWQGELTFDQAVRVQKGATLTVTPGTRVTFTACGLEIQGILQANGASFSGKDWDGIVLQRSASVLEDCTISGARNGLLVYGGQPRLSGLEVSHCETGIELRQQSRATLNGCRLAGNRVGLFVKDESVPVVQNCRFAENERFGAYLFRSQPKRFFGNRFVGNKVGLMIACFGSDPEIRGNEITENEVGVQIDRAARPFLTGNHIEGNDTGVVFSRRSDARVRNNRITDNRVGIRVEYSSYPVLRQNDLADNSMALVLNHQSSAWERANGSARRAGENRGAFGQRTPSAGEVERRPVALTGTVDARHNWWGESETAELEKRKGRGNFDFIHDSFDDPFFTDGGKNYPLDRVEIVPWLSKPE